MAHEWQLNLKPNTLTPDNPNDYVAEVYSRSDTLRNEQIAERIVAKRSEFRKETIESILKLRDEEVKEAIQEGLTFSDGLVRISPRVSGVWDSAKASFDSTKHKRTVDLGATKELRDALETVSVKVLGVKALGASILLVTDTATGKTDGTVTIGDDISIEGDKIKIQDTEDTAQGVFIIDASGAEHRVTRRLSANKPSEVVARIPADVPEGACKVVIRTKYSGGGTNVLKNVREIAYSVECKAVKE